MKRKHKDHFFESLFQKKKRANNRKKSKSQIIPILKRNIMKEKKTLVSVLQTIMHLDKKFKKSMLEESNITKANL